MFMLVVNTGSRRMGITIQLKFFPCSSVSMLVYICRVSALWLPAQTCDEAPRLTQQGVSMTVLDNTQSGCFGMHTASRRLHWEREQASLVISQTLTTSAGGSGKRHGPLYALNDP